MKIPGVLKRIIETVRPEWAYRDLGKLLNSYDRDSSVPAVLLFGDSVLLRTSRTDSDSTPLWKMIANNVSPAHGICWLCASAYNPRVYYHLLKVLTITRSKPRAIILSVNMRCFSPQWDLNPDWQFERQIRLIDQFMEDRRLAFPQRLVAGLRRFGLTSDGYGGALNADELFRNHPVRFHETSLNRVGDFLTVIHKKPGNESDEAHRWKTLFIFHYMYDLAPDNRKLRFLIRLVELALTMTIPLHFYITPINYLAGERHVGASFTDLLRFNVTTVKTVIHEAMGRLDDVPHPMTSYLTMTDLSCSLTPDHFFHYNDPTEHLNEKGRRKVSELLVQNSEGVFDSGLLHR